uniref:Uncharacterized protein n=1 Tax=Rhipicephalus zambeziensis TaxID=60191 RepID=A0A224YI46_9ACAR
MSRDCAYNGLTASVPSELAQTKKTIRSKKKKSTKNTLARKLYLYGTSCCSLRARGLTMPRKTCNAAQVTSVTCTNQETRQRREKYKKKITLPGKKRKTEKERGKKKSM